MSLPMSKSPPKADASKKFILLYGRSKIGKSTWASKIPGGIFVVTDPGLDEIEAFRVPADGVVKSWEELLGFIDEIAKSKKFQTIIIDTVDVAWQLCVDSVCKKAGVEYYTDGALSYGKGSAMIKAEFQRLLLRIKADGLGLVLISHAQEKEEESGGVSRSRWQPSLPRKTGEEITGLVDAILFADWDAQLESRVLRLKGSSRFQAGCRGGNYLPEKWPLEDHAGFMSAYTDSLKKNAETDGKIQKPVTAMNAKPAVTAGERR